MTLAAVVLTGSVINYFFKKFPTLKDRIAFIERARIPGRIDVNTAPIEELTKIPYVGDKRARQILKYRSEEGAFKTIEQIQEIYGIGPKTFQKMAPYIWAGPTKGE